MRYIRSNDGTKLAVYDPNPSGKEAVLLIHGWPLSHKMYEYQVDLLLCNGYRVITMDLRGFGESDAPAGGYCYNQMARDIYQIVRGLGLKSFILGGFSMGGAIALRYMRLFRGYGVCKLMLLAAAAPCWTQRKGFPFGKTREEADQLICQACADRPQLAYDFSHEQLFASCHGEPLKSWFEDIALSASGHGTIMTAISLRDEDGRCDLKSVHVPTAIYQGNCDIVVDSALTTYQYQHIPGAVLYELPESGHGVVYDQLELFNGYFMDFICK